MTKPLGQNIKTKTEKKEFELSSKIVLKSLLIDSIGTCPSIV